VSVFVLDESVQRPQYGRLPHLHLLDSLIRDQTRRYTGRVRLRELRAAHVDQRRHPAHVEREAIFVAGTLTVTSVLSFRHHLRTCDPADLDVVAALFGVSPATTSRSSRVDHARQR